MAYYKFKITRLPKRITLYIGNDLVELDKEYSMADENLIAANHNLGYAAEPMDDMGYKILPAKRDYWSDEIQFEFNVTPKLERPSCVSGNVPVLSKSLTDITALFPFADNSDRIRIDSITGINNNLMIQGQPIIYGKAYMIYDFFQIEWQSVAPSEVGLSNNFSIINYTMGKKNEWGDSCTVQVDLLILAAISSKSSYIKQTSPSFERTFYIENGIPGTYVLVNIVSSGDYDNFSAKMINADGNFFETFLSTSGDVLLNVLIDENGKSTVVLNGYPTLEDINIPYLRFIDVEILNSDGFTNLIDPVNFKTTMYITNDLDLLNEFNSILNVIMTNDVIGSVVDNYTQETQAPSSIDIVAEIKLRTNIGKPPFIYEITQTSGNPVGSIIQQTDSPKFDITEMVGASNPGNKFEFEAKVIDDNAVVSVSNFSFTVLDIVVASVPVITAPADIILEVDQFFTEYIIASNEPIISYEALYIPNGVTFSTSLGRISGKISIAGDYAMILRATNSAGTSVDYNFNIHVNIEVSVEPPLITSSVNHYVPSDNQVIYLLSYTGDEPITIIVENVPDGWYWNSFNNTLYGTLENPYEYVTFRLTNSAGVDEKIVTFYNT